LAKIATFKPQSVLLDIMMPGMDGYCEGLRTEDIPLSARIVALADVYDALTSERVYKPAYAEDVARDLIVGQSGTQFDPVVVDAFVSRFDDFRSAGSNYQFQGQYQ
jgi:putative two-component system response regulator